MAMPVAANHSIHNQLSTHGKPIGQLIPVGMWRPPEMGSIIVVIATDAPLSSLALKQVTRRTGLGQPGDN